MVTQEVRDIVHRFVEALGARGVHVDKTFVYGSVTKNRETADSDLDVAVISADFGNDRYSEAKLLNQVAWRIDTRIHPVPIQTSSYDNDAWNPLIHEIRTHGMEMV